jgi:hypothetical protein
MIAFFMSDFSILSKSTDSPSTRYEVEESIIVYQRLAERKYGILFSG